MEEEEEKEELKVEALNSIENVNQLDSLSIEQNIKEIKKRKRKIVVIFLLLILFYLSLRLLFLY